MLRIFPLALPALQARCTAARILQHVQQDEEAEAYPLPSGSSC